MAREHVFPVQPFDYSSRHISAPVQLSYLCAISVLSEDKVEIFFVFENEAE